MSSRNVLFATLLASILSGAALIAFASHGAAQRRPSPAPIPNDAPARPEVFNVTSQVDEVLHYLACRATMRGAVAQAIDDLSLEGRALRTKRNAGSIIRASRKKTAPTASADNPAT